MKNGICSKCQSNEVYISTTETHGVHVPISWLDVFTELYVCAKCGFIEVYVQHKSDLEKISKKLRKVKAK